MTSRILKIGVTGSAGSGKSLVCQGFKGLGLYILDCDLIARKVVEPGQMGYEKVVAAFGAGVLAGDKTLDRAQLRKKMLARPRLRKELEAILHPLIIKEMVRLMAEGPYPEEPACAVEVPLLFELNMAGYFDIVVVVTSPDERLVRRISDRDGVAWDDARKILDLQMAQADKIRRADHVIENTGSKEQVFRAVSLLYRKLKTSLDKTK